MGSGSALSLLALLALWLLFWFPTAGCPDNPTLFPPSALLFQCPERLTRVRIELQLLQLLQLLQGWTLQTNETPRTH